MKNLAWSKKDYTLQTAGAFQGSRRRALCDWAKSIIRKAVVAGVSIRAQILLEAVQECFRMAGTPPRLVVKQHDGPAGITTCAVQPHIAVAPDCFVRLMEHLQCGLIRVEDLPLQQIFVQLVIHRLQKMLCRPLVCIDLRLVKQQAQMLHSILATALGGRAEIFALR